MSSSTGVPSNKPADPYKEVNKDDTPSLKEKVEDLTAFIKGEKFGMMTTRSEQSGMLFSRCMALAATETGGIDLLFHTNLHSGKTSDLTSDAHCNIAFLNPSGEWASISGLASIDTSRSTVEQYYSPSLKAWLGDLGDGKHDGGPGDDRIGVIRVKAVTVTYAVVRRGVVGRGVEMAKGVVTGSVPSVNKLREISKEEVESWRRTATPGGLQSQ